MEMSEICSLRALLALTVALTCVGCVFAESEEEPDALAGQQSTEKPAADAAFAELQMAERLFVEAETMLNKSRGVASQQAQMRKAYRMLEEASAAGHRQAMELVSWAYLFGDWLPWNMQRARELFERLALLGSPRGQTGLGFLHAAGLAGLNSSQAKALIYWTFASLGGDPWAQMAVGYRYWAGVSVQQNCEAALGYYRRVAERVAGEVSAGSASSGAGVARVRLSDESDAAGSGQQSSTANQVIDNDLLQYYRFLADKGDVQAALGLGQLYLTGARGLERAPEQAFRYFQQAAEAGNAAAHAYLGKMYLDGLGGVRADNATARQYFERAAEKGNPIGQSGLGLMFLYGKGVERDLGKALKLLKASADQGWVDGQLHLAVMHYSGLGVRRDYKLAIKYFQLASQAGHVLAFFNLAQMHASGTGTLRNCHTAAELYKNVAERGRWAELLMEAHAAFRDGRLGPALAKYMLLAELGYEVAQSNLAWALDTGRPVPPLVAAAEVWPRALLSWARAAEQGSSHARLKLGDYYYYGLGTPSDFAQAAQHYKVASEQQHNAQAMFNLAYMHEQGLGIKRDIHLAKRFYDLAAETSSEAQVPVALALAKLSALFSLHYLTQADFWRLPSLERWLGPDWDIYAITALCLLLGLLFYLRRHRPQLP